jgi:hypothetical protein
MSGRPREGHALVILGYALSAENGRREKTKIASLRRVLCLGMRPPRELRVNIDVHGRRIVGGVVFRFLKETVITNTIHCYRRETQERVGGKK